MYRRLALSHLLLAVILCSDLHCSLAKSSDAIKLSDVKVLTLYHGRMTNGIRSSPVPQLKCIGGTAGCNAFIPQVVQCYNRGWDGSDYQWECKTDMDNMFRFGKISVSCEGYSYPDDPYILKGSCGLEYTLDLTKEGYENHHNQHNYYGGHDQTRSKSSENGTKSASSILGDLLFFVIVGFMIYALYKTCIRPMTHNINQTSSTDDDFGGGYPGSENQPPPPGFRPEFSPRNFPRPDASCGGEQSRNAGGLGSANNFWAGAATGGILGYMFGSRNNPGSATTTDYRTRSRAYESSFSNPTGDFGTSRARSPSSSGTRTASGFGGTTRR